MRNLVVTENITLDGVISPIGDWFAPGVGDDGLLAANTEFGRAADALVLGRVTYQEFAAYWPAQLDDDQTGIAAYLDQVAKYVVSASLDRADWVNSTILRGRVEDELAALKQQPGKDIVVAGSATLVRSLVRTGLVDLYRLFVYPVVQGNGVRLFPDGMSADMALDSARTFESGVVLLSYRPASPGGDKS